MKRIRETKVRRVEDYFSRKESGFLRLNKSSKKWKELYNQPESKWTIFLSFIMSGVLLIVYQNTSFNIFNEMLINILGILIGSAVGLLGFIISGLAIFTGTITSKLIKNVDDDEKFASIMGILFSFYFIGAFIGISIILYIIVYFFLWSELIFDLRLFVAMSLIVSYFFIFSILYSVSLLGTCLRLFLVSYKYSDENTKKGESKKE